MVSILHFICVFNLVFLTHSILSLQFYDGKDCENLELVDGSNYLCKTNKGTCEAYIVYKTQVKYQSVSAISSLFNLENQTQLLSLNNLNESTSANLHIPRDIIVPVNCSCSGGLSQDNFTYTSSSSDNFATVACNVFKGLLKLPVLIKQNPGFNVISNGVEVTVPVRCACPDEIDKKHGVKYLVTYPIVQYDNTSFIAKKFGVPEEKILAANNLDLLTTIYPKTALLIPINGFPVLNLEISPSPDTDPFPASAIPLQKLLHTSRLNNRNLWNPLSFYPLSSRRSELSSFSRDFLDGISKLKLFLYNFSLDDLRIATGGFCEDAVIGRSVYRGSIGDTHVAIEQMDSEEETHRVIDILTKINHLNIVRLEGFSHETTPCLVFEYADNGCLRDCLSNTKIAKELTWEKRMQILSDVAVGLHYIHHYTNPPYLHRNVTSKNVLLTTDWRAKISGFKLAKPITRNEDMKQNDIYHESLMMGKLGYLAPEYLHFGLVSQKVDVFAFGIILLELISAKEALVDGCLLKDSVDFLSNDVLEDTSLRLCREAKGIHGSYFGSKLPNR
ncbi:lysM domain receptor-like kinase 4 [Papaver somniferum]|uniref:lysM domain receptor-like kinase 4 n=1 Tax=Papaver somniferum TaxID=3469 RepID=UPI000E701280|nr:lysM domain receptor-like kinase 4 [Papaver somniferum]